VEVTLTAVDRQREENACDAAGEEFAHGERVAAHPQRRQDVEHVIVLGLADLEPLAAVEGTVIRRAAQTLRVPVEHAEHLPAVGGAWWTLRIEEGIMVGSFQPRRAGARLTLRIAILSSPSDPSFAAGSPVRRVKGHGTRAKPPLTRRPGMRHVIPPFPVPFFVALSFGAARPTGSLRAQP
jgi:hypothetical protein